MTVLFEKTPDKSYNSTCTDINYPMSYWDGTLDGFIFGPLEGTSNGNSSVSDFVDSTIPITDSYWRALPDGSNACDAYILMRYNALSIENILTLGLRIYTNVIADMTLDNVWVYYESSNNPTMTEAIIYLGSGYIASPHTFASGSDHYELLDLNLANASEYTPLLLSGVPTVNFDLVQSISMDQNQIYYVALSGEYNSQSSGSIPLYTISTISENSGIDLYTSSSAKLSGVTDLYLAVAPEYTSGSVPLYLYGHMVHSGTVDLYIGGVATASGDIPLYIAGHLVSSGDIPLYMLGSEQSSGNIPLYMYGHARSSGSLPLFIGHNTNNYSSGNFPLYMWGTTTSGLYSTIPFSMNVNTIANEQILPLFIEGGGYLGKPSGTMPLVLLNTLIVPSESSGIPLYLGNFTSSSSSNVPLYMSVPNYVPKSGTLNLFISRDAESISQVIPLFLYAPLGEYSGIPLYILGGEFSANDNIPLYTSASDMQTSLIKLYTHGF